MAEIETLGILEEIESLVSDRLQVVSYKWLSRNFLVSSNVAKKLLEEFAEKNNQGLEVVYSLAGWLKQTPPTYHIKLVPRPKLAEAKEDFADNCSVQVYSIQSCIPKDPVALWNAEFVQAEELFKQPADLDNCLRDNRFCGISNSFAKRNSSGTTNNAAPQAKGVSVAGSSANQVSSFPQPQHRKPQQSSSKDVPSIATAVKSEGTNASAQGAANKLFSNTTKAGPPASKNKGQTDKRSSGSGGLANFWDRASAKSKSSAVPEEANTVAQIKNDVQIAALEALDGGSSDDERLNVNLKRASNGDSGKKRRFLMDDSDEDVDDNDVVNLASPDPPKAKSILDSKRKNESLNLESKGLKLDDEEPKVKEDKSSGKDINQPLKDDSSGMNKDKTIVTAVEKIHDSKSLNDAGKKNRADTKAPTSPKRRKVLKTRIDERGREVTEVVWEGEDTKEQKKENAATNGKNQMTKTEEHAGGAAANPVSRPTTVKKSPTAANTTAPLAASKAGNKKGGNKKDPKQGNILSFFKKT